MAWDFTDCPDLAQTICVVAAIKKIPLTLTGLESLKVKETDRVLALQNELLKLNATLVEVEKNHKYQVNSTFEISQQIPAIDTYDDHRMAMAFAPVGVVQEIIINEPEVVNKSYPSFWKHIQLILKTE